MTPHLLCQAAAGQVAAVGGGRLRGGEGGEELARGGVGQMLEVETWSGGDTGEIWGDRGQMLEVETWLGIRGVGLGSG